MAGEMQRMDEFDLTDPLVREKVEERWGGDPPPDDIVISPEAIFRSDLMVTVAVRYRMLWRMGS